MIKCAICGEEFKEGEEFIGHVEYIARKNLNEEGSDEEGSDEEGSEMVQIFEQTVAMIYMHKDCLLE